MARLSDYLLTHYTPINDKMAYKESVGLKQETPFIGVVYQFVKMFEDFWFSLLGIFKLNRKDRTFSQSKFANACKMAFLSVTYLLANFFIPVYRFASNKDYYNKIVTKFFSERNVKSKDDRYNRYTNIIKSLAISFLHWVSSILESVLNLVRAILLIVMSLPIIITSPIRYLLPVFNEMDALNGRKISRAIETFVNHKIISNNLDANFVKMMDVLIHLKRRISSGHLEVNNSFWEALTTLKNNLDSPTNTLGTIAQEFQKGIKKSGTTTVKLNPISSETLGGEKQLSLSLLNNIGDAVSHVSTKLTHEEKMEQLKTLVGEFRKANGSLTRI